MLGGKQVGEVNSWERGNRIADRMTRLKAAGMEFNGSPVKFGDGSIFTYGRDPDGNIIELLEIPAGADTPKI